MIAWISRKLGFTRRYGIRYARGMHEKNGFRWPWQADHWAADNGISEYVRFHYEPIDLRIFPDGHKFVQKNTHKARGERQGEKR